MWHYDIKDEKVSNIQITWDQDKTLINPVCTCVTSS